MKNLEEELRKGVEIGELTQKEADEIFRNSFIKYDDYDPHTYMGEPKLDKYDTKITRI
jgi:hypothetical protein